MKRFKECVSCKNKSNIKLTVGNDDITNLINDKKNLRAFLTNEVGQYINLLSS